ncbi:MAG: hypothetical protein HY202_08590 [Nitrospirae bacterium]|nr:hypothetical protein [Nitrospirota bacterium]
MKSNLIKLTLFVLLLVYVSPAHAWLKETHQYMNEKIAKNPMNGFWLDNYLRTNLGFFQGIAQPFNGSDVVIWISNGGEFEDVPAWYNPYFRSVNHFHNPLTKSGYSGYWGGAVLSGRSAIEWSQAPMGTQSPGGYYSWYDVRNDYYKALTLPLQADRDTQWAETFRGIGQLMHLVQDMGVPDHSRDDGYHSVFYGIENWVNEKKHVQVLDTAIASPVFMNTTTLALTSSPFSFPGFSLPITNLFDSNQYKYTNGIISLPGVTLNSFIGLSEYSHANFFSPKSIYKYPYPALTSSYEYTQMAPGTSEIKTYLNKNADGVPVNHLAAIGWFTKYLPLSQIAASNGFGINLVDDQVLNDYASLLLPRAVGYSANLLNYFFRGQIALSAPDRFVYALGMPGGFFGGSFNGDFKVKALNVTPTGEAMTGGTIQLVIKYRLPGYDPIQNPPQTPPVPTPSDFNYIVVPEKFGKTTLPTNGPNVAPVELTFDLSTNPLPFWTTDVYIQVVYQGQLGNEPNAVAVGFKDISEPTPIVFGNDMDKICLYGSYIPAGSQQAITAVQTLNAFSFQVDPYAHNLTNYYIKFTSPTAPVWPTSLDHDATIPVLNQGNYGKIHVLADYTPNSLAVTTAAQVTPADPNDHFTSGFHPVETNGVIIGQAVKYQTDFSLWPQYTTTYPNTGLFRGTPFVHLLMYENAPYPYPSTCLLSTILSALPNVVGPAAMTIP